MVVHDLRQGVGLLAPGRAHLIVGLLLAVAGPVVEPAAALAATPMSAPVGASRPRRIVISVGHNQGLRHEEPLRFAETDARRFADIMVELGGARRQDVVVLQRQPPARVLKAIASLGQRLATTAGGARGSNAVEVFFYYAGHGDKQALHLGGHRLALGELRQRLQRLPVRLRVLFIDSCQGSGASRRRGVTRGAAFNIGIVAPAPGGTVVVTSASDGEPAQESDQLRGAVFSHYLFSGLRGPADGDRDRRVTLLRTARDRGSVQHPAYDVQLKGTGSLVLTRTVRASARLWLPPGPGVRYFVYRVPSLTVMAEVPGDLGRHASVALPAGRFLIQRRAAQGTSELEVHLPWGGERRLAADAFRPVPGVLLAARGAPTVPARWTLAMGYRVAPWSSTTGELGHGGSLGLAVEWGRLGLGLTLTGVGSSVVLERHRGTEWHVGVRPRVWYVFDQGRYAVGLGAGGLVAPTVQHLEHDDAERLRRIGVDPDEHLWSTAWGGFAFAHASLYLASWLSLWLEVDGGARVLRLAGDGDSGTGVLPDVGINLGLGHSF